MRIESFHIQGFKSLADVKVEGLSDINVFYGLNNVGKSNVFQALVLWKHLISWHPLETSKQFSLAEFKEEFGPSLSHLGGHNTIRLKVNIILNRPDFPHLYDLIYDVPDDLDEAEQSQLTSELDRLTSQLDCMDELRIVSETELKILSSHQVIYHTTTRTDLELLSPSILSTYLLSSTFHVIQATRRFQIEQKGERKNIIPGMTLVSDYNLKQALFYAYLSRNLQQKRRLATVKRILFEPPFSLGELDIALDPSTDRIDIGFVRSDGRLPLENMGSGVQQLLLVLGQIFLNDYPIITIEEPEMNLSPQYQQYLLVALRRLMQDPDVKLNQLFISTHSPYFEFEENFFDVKINEQGTTQVNPRPIEERHRYFPDIRLDPEGTARLNSFNQIKLYDGVIENLGLQRGDLVMFTKNEAGRWEIRPEREIIRKLQTASNNKET